MHMCVRARTECSLESNRFYIIFLSLEINANSFDIFCRPSRGVREPCPRARRAVRNRVTVWWRAFVTKLMMRFGPFIRLARTAVCTLVTMRMTHTARTGPTTDRQVKYGRRRRRLYLSWWDLIIKCFLGRRSKTERKKRFLTRKHHPFDRNPKDSFVFFSPNIFRWFIYRYRRKNVTSLAQFARCSFTSIN